MSFFGKGFKAAKCKTLLKLTIPRIKLLRNRREIQLKQMRKDIAKLLETGQEATARVRVEHIIREEKMMAAQEIIELFCELISVRLPIIEAQRECPLDLKEAISSLCFAAPRCADLSELQQVQMLFAGKYGKEFVTAATELLPDCGVNRQFIELLSVRVPSPDVKLKLLKEIAVEHELDWDTSESESQLLRPREDLLNGPTQLSGGSKVPLPNPKQYETSYSSSVSKEAPHEESDSDDEFELLDLPEAPRQPIQTTKSSRTHSSEQSDQPRSIQKNKSESNIDLQDVLAAAQAAAESAESAAAAARSAARLAQSRISELTKKNDDEVPSSPIDNPFHLDTHKADSPEKHHVSNHPSYDDASPPFGSPPSKNHSQTLRSSSIDDEDPYFSYPNLFSSHAQSFNSRSSGDS